jgi:hypothetical protein
MKRMYVGVVLGFLIFTTSLLAGEVDNTYTFRKLDKKISDQLKGDRWNYASRTFVRVLWDDYKIAHENTQPELSATRYPRLCPICWFIQTRPKKNH